MSEKIQRIDYRCRISMNKEPFSIALINYMKHGGNINERDKVLSALFGYWLPFALKADGNFSEQEVKQYVRNTIYKLKLHIAYLSEVFFLEDFPVDSSTIISAKPMVQQVVSNLAGERLIEPDKPQPSIDFLCHEHDFTFETMFP
ncbi:hypothetical protein [Nostoc commune]|uniref:hypothetical protein n=1 Tax=Nostoc commune TaxID=1178 RepID=UPI0018C83C78|nr:hypothetical protein [Nostoc commune]MBG1263168.1 hypothetical protein [Nostoc commune BAE]